MDEIPGKDLIFLTGAAYIEIRIYAAGSKGLIPFLLMIIFTPGIKSLTMFINILNDICHFTVASGQYTLQDTDISLVPVVFNALLIQLRMDLSSDDARTVKKFFLTAHGSPLERSERFRYKEGCTDNNLHFAVSLILGNLIISLCDLFRQMSDFLHVFLSLCGKPQHKVQFYAVPAALKGLSCAVQDIFLCESFIDNITHTLRTGLRSKSQAALADILYLFHDIQRKSIDTQRRQRNIDTAAVTFVDQKVYQLRKLAVIAGA